MSCKIGVVLPQVKEHFGLLAGRRGNEESFPCMFQGDHGSANTLILDFQLPGQWEDIFLLF